MNKKLYPFATLLSSILLTLGAQAQTYTGGTYTAVRNGNWHVTSGPNVWDPSGEPPANCSNCAVIINSGVTVTLNTHISFMGSSLLKVGTDGSAATLLQIPSSGGADFSSGYNIILPNDGSNPTNTLKMSDASSFINASGAGTYDGVLTAFASGTSTTYFKQIGNAPGGFVDNTVASNTPAARGSMLTGPVTMTANGTLPITLTDFAAVLNAGAVDLTWKTQMEQNSDHFDIERSSNGGAKWDVIGKVAAAGYSALPLNYSFTDANPGSGTLQYRVHGYDKDGRPTLSPIKTIRTTPIATVSVYPNPAKDYVNVALPAGEATTGSVSIRLFGQSGQLLAERNVTGAGGTIQSFAVSNYPPGNYLIQVTTADGSKQVNKVMISK